jgi:RNA polymerase sigma-70 factor (ECF subfamily)
MAAAEGDQAPKKPRLDPKTQFRELYEQEYPAVYRTVRAMVLDGSAAEDLTQEAFIRAYRARDRYRPTAPPGAWVHRIAVNVAISHLRREKLARIITPRLLLGPDSGGYERAEARTVLETALARLSPKVRAAVVLHYYHGYTREEVAAALGIPPGTVASRIAKAMHVMRQALGVSEQFSEPARSTR